MQKGSGSGKGGAGAKEPQAKAGTPLGQGAAILSEPTQQLDAARIQAREPAPAQDSVLDVDDVWEDLASEDSDGEVEALSDDDVSLDEASAVHDVSEVLSDELDDALPPEDAGAGLSDIDDQPTGDARVVAPELSSRLDVSDDVIEELSFPKHLAASSAGLQPRSDPLFDNVPTQQASEELRAALLKRGLPAATEGAIATLRGDQVAKKLAAGLITDAGKPATLSRFASGSPAQPAAVPQPQPLATVPASQTPTSEVAASAAGKVAPRASAQAPAAAKRPADEGGAVVAPSGRVDEPAKVAAPGARADDRAKAAARGVRTDEPAKAAAFPVRADLAAAKASSKPTAADLAKAPSTAAAASAVASPAASHPVISAAKATADKPTADKPTVDKPTADKSTADKSTAAKATADKPTAASKDVAAKAPASKGAAGEGPTILSSEAVKRSLDEKIKPIAARLGTTDVTLVEMAPAPAPTGPQAATKKSAVDTQPIVSTAVGPATPTLIVAAPIPLSVKLPQSAAVAPSAIKSMGPISVAVPAALLKKEPASSKPIADRSVADSRPAGHGLSGATFVLPSSKEVQPTPVVARTVARTRSLPARDVDETIGGGSGGGGGDAAGPGASAPGGPPRDEIRRGIEQRVQKRAREFSLPALLDVLQLLDYRPDEIEYLGVMSYGFPGSLIHSVDFIAGPRRIARVSLHMGLLSAQSPLPSYFLKYAEQLEIDALFDFLGFFDHHLLKRRASSLYPERDRTLFADWSETQAQLLQLIGLTAPSTLHWLFQRVYPELGVEVRRSTERKPLNAEGVVLGNAKLGEACAFGGGTTVPVGGLEVTLYSEEELTPTGDSWAVEASLRLNRQVFSALGETDVYLTVYLVIMEQTSWLTMEDERYLGFEPLWEDLRGDLKPPGPPAVEVGIKGKGGRSRQTEIMARSRSAYRIHQMQLFSGPIKAGKTGSTTELLSGMTGT